MERHKLQPSHALWLEIEHTFRWGTGMVERILDAAGWPLSHAHFILLRRVYMQQPCTAPELIDTAHRRREHILALLRDLRDYGVVKTKKNPKHKTSSLWKCAAAGKKWLAWMEEAAEAMGKRVKFNPEEVAIAMKVVQQFRRYFQMSMWHKDLDQLLKKRAVNTRKRGNSS